MKPQSPCKNCEEREVGCHSACERYALYCAVLEDWKETVRKEQTDGAEADTYRITMIRRIKGIK